MRILYLANSRFPTVKAHGVQIMKSCEGFALAGATIELAAVRRASISADEIFQFYGVAHPFALSLLRMPNLRRLGGAGYRAESFWFAVRAAIHALRTRPDFIYARDEKVLWILTMLGFHNCIWETHDRSWNYFSRRVVRRVPMIIATSNRLQEFYIGHGVPAARVAVAAHAIDQSEFASLGSQEEERTRHGLPLNRSIIAYVGKFKTMGESKGVEELVEAVRQLLRTGRGAFLLLVGLNEDEFAPLEELLRAAGFKKNDYRLVGHVPHAQVPAYMRAADVLVMNYPRTEHYESVMSPVKTLEYMASGTPIVASDLRSIREVLDEHVALLVPPDDIGALAVGIAAVLADSAGSLQKAGAARLFALDRTWERRARGILGALMPDNHERPSEHR